MSESIERMRKLVNDNLVMGLRFQMNRELNKLESEIEQELNSRAERTCHIEGSYYDEPFDETCTILSCGHVIWQDESPNYCSECGAKIIERKD